MRTASVNISLVEEFVYLANSLSFKATADHFYVSRSVISRHMTALEDAIGARLLERDSRTVGLTEAGRVFYRDARSVLHEWETALAHVAEAQRSGAAIVRVGYLRNAARPVLVPFMRSMTQRHPEVRVTLDCLGYADLRRAMEKRSVDIAVAMNVSPSISRNYRSTLIYEDEFLVACAASHPLAQIGRSLKLSDLMGEKVLLPNSLRDMGLTDLPEMLADVDASDAAALFYGDVDMMSLKIQTEGCVALLSSMNGELFGDEVAVLPLSDVRTSFSVSAFYQDDFTGAAHDACREAFEQCGAAIAKRRR